MGMSSVGIPYPCKAYWSSTDPPKCVRSRRRFSSPHRITAIDLRNRKCGVSGEHK